MILLRISQQEMLFQMEYSLKQLQGFEYVVHLRNFMVDEIIRIAGWDKEREALIFETVYPFVAKGVGDEKTSC